MRCRLYGVSATILTWGTCPMCGALCPLFEHPAPPERMQPLCCGELRLSRMGARADGLRGPMGFETSVT